MNGYECVQFKRKGIIDAEHPTQHMVVQRPRMAVLRSGSAIVKGGSAAPRKNGKATNSISDQTKPKKKVYHQKIGFPEV